MLASSATQRTGGIGVRLALGAQRREVMCMVLYDGLRLVGVELLPGAGGLWAAAQLLTATAALLATISLVAALLPALRAASVDPIKSLRAEYSVTRRALPLGRCRLA